MKKYPVVLTIAGSDSSGGAGIQADLKTIEVLGGFGTTVITALTAQNTLGVKEIFPVPPEFVREQFEAIASDIEINAVKTGMLHSVEIVETIVECLKKYNIKKIIVDPVMVATSGDKLIQDNTIEIIKSKLFPIATVITPNLDEAELILNREINCIEDMKSAARALLDFNCKGVLVKGGHIPDDDLTDVFYSYEDENYYLLESKRIHTNNTHGTGCTLSASIATYCALGCDLKTSISKSHEYIYGAISSGANYRLGRGNGPLHHSFKFYNK